MLESEVQATIELAVELEKFYNIDLFHRGFYQLRICCRLRNEAIPFKVEVNLPKNRSCNLSFPAAIMNGYALSKTFQVLYPKQKIRLNDLVIFRVHLLVNPDRLVEQIQGCGLQLNVELYFSDQQATGTDQQDKLSCVSQRTIDVNMSLAQSLHQYMLLMFDYFYLSAVSFVVHGALLAVHQPCLIFVDKSGQTKGTFMGRSPEQSTLDCIFFGSPQWSAAERRLHAFKIHERICRTLLTVYESLRLNLDVFNALLPKTDRVLLPSTQSAVASLEKHCTILQELLNEDDILQTGNTNIIQICASLMVLWKQLVDNLTFKRPLVSHLAERRHTGRVKRFAEAFLHSDHPVWLCHRQLLGDQPAHADDAERIRNSDYMQLIPSLPLQSESDGHPTSIPIIFEDVYSSQAGAASAHDGRSLLKPPAAISAGITSISTGQLLRLGVSPLCQRSTNRKKMFSGAKRYDEPLVDTGSVSLVAVKELHEDHGLSDRSSLALQRVFSEPSPKLRSRLKKALSFTSRRPARKVQRGLSAGTEYFSGRPAGQSPPVFHLNSTEENSRPDDGKKPCESAEKVHKSLNRMASQSERCLADEEKTGCGSGGGGGSSSDGRQRCSELASESSELAGIASVPNLQLAANECLSVENRRLGLLVDDRLVRFVEAKESLRRAINAELHFYSDRSQQVARHPYLCSPSKPYQPWSSGLHLIVCVHGLEGNSFDLRLFCVYLRLALPGERVEFVMSEANQNDTFTDIGSMAERLANEVESHLELYKSSGSLPTRISFVGHSLGNIIIRSILDHEKLAPYVQLFHTYLSLSGPHLGTFYSSNLVSLGMWIMRKWKRSEALLQLSLKDQPDYRKCYLYQLSQRRGLNYFKNVLLLASPQDRYVPYNSARIDHCLSAMRDSSLAGQAYGEMVDNILKPLLSLKDFRLVRYDVFYPPSNSSANSLIGRAAHIASLDSDVFLEKFISVSLLKYFI